MSAGGVNNQSSTGLRVSVDGSRTRQTAKTDFGSVMKTGLSRAADAVVKAGNLAAPFVPGGAIVSAAISGMGELKSAAGANTSSTSVGGNSSTMVLGGSSGSAAGGGSSVAADVRSRAASGSEADQRIVAAQDFQEMNMSFNMQYLMLQQKMQSDNRQFTLLSNIMKTKHDTAKNAISNVR